MSEVVDANIQAWRAKCADNTMSKEEYRDVIEAIRKERVGASNASAVSKEKKATAKAKAAPINTGDLLRELGL